MMGLAKTRVDWLGGRLTFLASLLGLLLGSCFAQAVSGAGGEGRILKVPLPLDEIAARRMVEKLEAWAAEAPRDGERLTVVLQVGGEGGRDSRFEPSLALARWLTSPAAAQLRTVAWVTEQAEGHAVLPVIACEQLIVASAAKLGPVSVSEDAQDPAVRGFYRSVAERRAKIPLVAVDAMLDPSQELVALGRIDGTWEIASGKQLETLRASGVTWNETPLSVPGQPTSFDGSRMRELRWAAHLVETENELLQTLNLTRWLVDEEDAETERIGAVIQIDGVIHHRLVDRVENEFNRAIVTANTVILSIDSVGGDLRSSQRLAMFVSSLRQEGIRVVAFVPKQALADSVLIAAACERLYVGPDAILGGEGESSPNPELLRDLQPGIEEAVTRHGRELPLVLALLNPDDAVVEYRDQQTGRVAFFRPDDLMARKDQERWTRIAELDARSGLHGSRAVELKLADGSLETLAAVAETVGLDAVPEQVPRNALLVMVESIGRRWWLAPLLMFVGMGAFFIEANTPGVGAPGFVGVICIGGFIWINYLNGTAEWLEVCLLILGAGCLAVELLVLPGFGVFGIGGIVMLVAGIVLTSQSFVLPHNDFQYARSTQGLTAVMFAIAGVVTAFIVFRRYLELTPGLKHLLMDEPTQVEVQEREKRESLSQLDRLVGEEGTAVTPLVPSGKVRIGEQIHAVVSDGTLVEAGTPVRVVHVQGARIVVEPR